MNNGMTRTKGDGTELVSNRGPRSKTGYRRERLQSLVGEGCDIFSGLTKEPVLLYGENNGPRFKPAIRRYNFSKRSWIHNYTGGMVGYI